MQPPVTISKETIYTMVALLVTLTFSLLQGVQACQSGAAKRLLNFEN